MITFVILLFCHYSWSLEWVRFSVPVWALGGDQVRLTCEFDVEGERLYSVKWYKSGREFYRYVPGEWPTQQAFAQPGVRVDVSRSDDQHVSLQGLTEDSSGRYKCEVLTEAPLFKTLVKSQEMTVVELPQGQPEVNGGQKEYRPGDMIHLNCSAPKSRPPATLTWFINEQQAPSDYLIEYTSTPDTKGRVSPLLGLKFQVTHWHFHNGELHLRCSAKLRHFYNEDAQHNGVAVLTIENERIMQENITDLAQNANKCQEFFFVLLLPFVVIGYFNIPHV